MSVSENADDIETKAPLLTRNKIKMRVSQVPRTLQLLPYQEALRAYLRQQETEVWQWFAKHRGQAHTAEAVRFELLKSTYRMEPEAHPALYETAQEVASRLELDVPITLYQAQNPAGLNASLVSLPEHAHIVFHGPITTRLTPVELRALLAHELTHLLLWREWDGEFLIVDEILAALTHDAQAEPPHFATARLASLYAEVFCDRGALHVVGDLRPVVSMLVKIETQMDEVEPDSYLRQAEEIFQQGPAHAEQLTHPEAFIRARALQLWASRNERADELIATMIEGPVSLDQLDLITQQRVEHATQALVDRMLTWSWMRSELVIAHARLFFADYEPRDGGPDDVTAQEAIVSSILHNGDERLREYFCYVLLDLVTADRELEHWPLMAALAIAERLELGEPFAEIARRELRLRKRQLERIHAEKEQQLAAGPGEGTPP